MAYKVIPGVTPKSWIGLSTDTKPTEPLAGSTYYEYNTSLKWIFDGTTWVKDLIYVKIAYGTSTAITITLNGLASSATAGQESTVIDNTANKFLDAIVTVTLKAENLVLANDQAAYVYAYNSEDGTNYSDMADGVDSAHTPLSLPLVKVIPLVQNVSQRGVFAIAQAFGGIMPRKWGIVVRNYSGQALAAAGNNASYTGIYTTGA